VHPVVATNNGVLKQSVQDLHLFHHFTQNSVAADH